MFRFDRKYRWMFTFLAAIAVVHAPARASAQAQSVFRASVNACGVAPTSQQQGVEAQVATGPNSCDPSGSTSFASASSGPAGMGGTAGAHYVCCGSAVGSQSIVRTTTEFIVDGPAPTASVGLNLDLQSLVVPIAPLSGHDAGMTLRVVIGSSPSIGWASTQAASNSSGLTTFPISSSTPTRIVVSPVTVPTGQAVTLVIELEMGVTGYVSTGDISFAMNPLLTFARTGPVFTLPPGFTVRDMPLFHVFGNQWYETTGVDPSPRPVAGALSLTPNPSRGDVALRWSDAAAGVPVRLEVFSIDGRRVRSLVFEGSSAVIWDRRDDRGALVRPGMYVVRAPGSRSDPARVVILN